jgi:hypothetical protein
MISLLYVSRSRLGAEQEKAALADIVEVAVHRNLGAGVTGALVHTGPSFAQILEGPEDAVEEILSAIIQDSRHGDLRVEDRRPAALRRFANWGMVLLGHESSTEHRIAEIRGAEATRTAKRRRTCWPTGWRRAPERGSSERLPAGPGDSRSKYEKLPVRRGSAARAGRTAGQCTSPAGSASSFALSSA